MICPICKTRTANFHLTDASKKQKSLHICDECKKHFSFSHLLCADIDKLKEQFITETNKKSTNTLMLMNIPRDEVEIQKLIEEHPNCNKCGNSINNILTKGIFGCENDFFIYSSLVERLLLETQGSALHIGKQYFHSDGERQASKISTLEFNLKKAIENENYEIAGQITKEINSIKKI